VSLAAIDAWGSSPAAERDDLGRAGWLAVVVAAAARACVGFWDWAGGSMWQDESATFDVTSRTLPQILATPRHTDAVHQAYYAPGI
jgi:hypothetical protein